MSGNSDLFCIISLISKTWSGLGCQIGPLFQSSMQKFYKSTRKDATWPETYSIEHDNYGGCFSIIYTLIYEIKGGVLA